MNGELIWKALIWKFNHEVSNLNLDHQNFLVIVNYILHNQCSYIYGFSNLGHFSESHFSNSYATMESHHADFFRVLRFREFKSRFHNSIGFLDQSVSWCLPSLHWYVPTQRRKTYDFALYQQLIGWILFNKIFIDIVLQ